MSDWTYERHQEARQDADAVAIGSGGACERAGLYLGAALDEIERLRSIAGDPDAIERAVQGMMQACQDSLCEDIDWDAEQHSWFERDARAALRAALNPKDGEQA